MNSRENKYFQQFQAWNFKIEDWKASKPTNLNMEEQALPDSTTPPTENLRNLLQRGPLVSSNSQTRTWSMQMSSFLHCEWGKWLLSAIHDALPPNHGQEWDCLYLRLEERKLFESPNNLLVFKQESYFYTTCLWFRINNSEPGRLTWKQSQSATWNGGVLTSKWMPSDFMEEKKWPLSWNFPNF